LLDWAPVGRSAGAVCVSITHEGELLLSNVCSGLVYSFTVAHGIVPTYRDAARWFY